MLSKNPLMSRSRTQSWRQHWLRATRRASCAERLGRYPYEFAWNTGSSNGSSRRWTTICAIRSATVGMPNGRVLPSPFGMSTRLTGGGK